MNSLNPHTMSQPGRTRFTHRVDQCLTRLRRISARGLACGLAVLLTSPAHAATALADQPLFASVSVPGNLALALSVEFPTVVSVAHTDGTYSSANTYLGYFDPNKCYLYNYSSTETSRYFYPNGAASSRVCTGGNDSKWSGNFLNWATMQTIDPFRWALTGGYRSTDTASLTILEKAWASGQGGEGNFPNRSLGDSTRVSENTPFSWSSMSIRIQGLGNKIYVTRSGGLNDTPTVYNPTVAVDTSTTYELSVRVKVCDPATAAGGLEANCVAYTGGNYKPEGLMQKYANKIRYSVFGYLNDDNIQRDGGVLRAQQKFVGPTYPVLGLPDATNTVTEWSASTGVYVTNPDSQTSSMGVTISNSGALNYLNKFGQISPGNYKTYDPVGELYYAALRYYKNLGNVPEWTAQGSASATTRATWADDFPVYTSWNDPIQYSCQRNFILGIGDVNSHADKNVPGGTGTGNEPAKPSTLSSDPFNAQTATNAVGVMQGLGTTLGSTENYNGCCNNNSALMAGLAYYANTKDIRPDVSTAANTLGLQTVQTYWLDVQEYQVYKKDNQFYLAAKYGGFKVPTGFDPNTRTAALDPAWWHTNTDTVGSGSSLQDRPDNFFTASRPDQVVSGLTRAFADIAQKASATVSSSAVPLAQVSLSGGNVSYSASWAADNWNGELDANELTYDATTLAPTLTPRWSLTDKLANQLGGTGWDTGRFVATRNTDTGLAVPFRAASLSTAQNTALATTYASGVTVANYVNYLRGDRSLEGSKFRTRTTLLGDIVGAKPKVVGPPNLPLSNSSNPGYSAFKTAQASRTTMVYVGSNDGMVHAVNGKVSGTNAGKELWAYVPGALYAGPSSTPATNGLAALGNPSYSHRYYVDGPLGVYDIDFAKTVGGPTGPAWRSVLIGGLGKGGKSYYAIDVTDPTMGIVGTDTAAQAETKVAGKVMWEFSDSSGLGFTFGEPAVVKTRVHGWVVLIPSGYNNADGEGRIFVLNARTGALIRELKTGVGTTTVDAGLAQLNAFIVDRTDGTADAVYAGDLLGNLWRFDLTVDVGTTALTTLRTHLATLTDSSGTAQPITSRPLVEVHPVTKRRVVLAGAGRLLATADISSTQNQSYYAIRDGVNARFNLSANLPTGVSFPIGRSNLAANTASTGSTAVAVSSTQMGWYLDLGAGWRVVSDASAFFGNTTFSSTLPTGAECSASGSSRIYSLDFDTGLSELRSGTTALAYIEKAAVVNEIQNLSISGKRQISIGLSDGTLITPATAPVTRPPLRQLNWRELPVAN